MAVGEKAPTRSPPWLRSLGWGLFVVAVLGVPLVALLRQRSIAEAPPVLGQLPDFALLDQEGRPFQDEDLAGKVAVLDFIFTRCPDVCPLLTSQMRAIQETLPARPFDGPPLHLVSVSVDPAFDRPEVLAAYARSHGADLSSWSFLTGEPAAIDALVAGLAQGLERTEGEGAEPPTIVHSQRLLLVDPAGRIRGFHPMDEAGLDALVRDLEAIAAEAEAGG